MTQDKSRDELIKEFYYIQREWTPEDYADYILSRESELIRNHEILTKTIVDTKNAEINELVEMVRKPLMNQKKFKMNIGNFGSNSSDDAIDEAIKILDEYKKG